MTTEILSLSPLSRRPVGVTLLALLGMVGGLLLSASYVLALGFLPSPLLWLALLLIAVPGFASGVVLWRGTRWGWWLAAYVYCEWTARALLNWYFSIGVYGTFFSSLQLTPLGRAVVGAAFLAYLLRPKVFAYVGIAPTLRWRFFLLALGAALVLRAVMFTVNI